MSDRETGTVRRFNPKRAPGAVSLPSAVTRGRRWPAAVVTLLAATGLLVPATGPAIGTESHAAHPAVSSVRDYTVVGHTCMRFLVFGRVV